MSGFKEEEKELILKLKNDDIRAFDSLFEEYSEKLFRFSFSLLKNEEDSREIVQEAFLRIWKKRKNVDSSKSFKSFLFTISYNLIIDQLRDRLKEKSYREFLSVYFEYEKIDLESKLDYDILKKQIDTAVEELPNKRKQIFKLSRENGLSNKEIANKLGISVKTVENQITLSLKHLKIRLGKSTLPVLLFLSLFL